MAISTVSQRFMLSNSVLKTVEAYVVQKFFEVGPSCFSQIELSTHSKKERADPPQRVVISCFWDIYTYAA